MKSKTLGLLALVIVFCATLEAVSATPQQAAPKPPLFPYTINEARELEKKNALPITNFYDTPKAPKGPAGELIAKEEFSQYSFPGEFKPANLGIKVVRFLYWSKAAFGELVPASGVVLIPYGKPPDGGWPVVVWAHGTSGVGRPCAPSLMKDLYYGWQGLLQ